MDTSFTYHTNRQLSDLFGAWLLADSLAEAAGYENERLNSLSELRYKEYDKAHKAHANTGESGGVDIIPTEPQPKRPKMARPPLRGYADDYADTIASFLEGTR